MGYGPRGLAVNQICFVGDEERSFVLKTGFPEPELFTEMRVLQHWHGRKGCVQLLDFDEDDGIMLLQRIQTGETFRSQPIPIRSKQIPKLFQRTPKSVQDELPRFTDWLDGAFEIYQGEALRERITFARSLHADLSRDARPICYMVTCITKICSVTLRVSGLRLIPRK